MRVPIIIGNGLNYLLEDIVRSYDDTKYPAHFPVTKIQIADSVREITQLWKKFDELFAELKQKAPKLSEEELIRLIYSVLDIFSNIKIFEKVLKQEDVQKIKDVFGQFLVDKVRQISNEFREHQDSDGYKYLKRLFPSFGADIQKLVDENGIQKLNIYTTNYDGILDTLLTGNPYGFIFVDGFSKRDNPDLLTIWPPYIYDSKMTISHIHGSYRYIRQYGTTYKLRTNGENTDPVMVFNNPDFKEEKIKNDNVLGEYYHNLTTDLKESGRLIIFGNSMTNEPHLKDLIKTYFNNEGNTIYICSRSPEQIHEQIKKVFQFNVVYKSTGQVKTIEGLVEIIKDVLTHGR